MLQVRHEQAAVHLDLDPTEIGKNYPVEIGIVADARALLEWLRANSAPSDYARSDYFAEVQRLREEWLAQVRELAYLRIPLPMLAI